MMRGLNMFGALLMVGALSWPATAAAEGLSFDGEQCQVELNYDMQVSTADMVITNDNGELYRYVDGSLFVGDHSIALNADQQQQLQQFQQQLHQGSAMLLELIEAAMKLAVDVVDDVFKHFELDSSATEQMFADLQQQIEAAIAQRGDTYTFAAEMVSQTEQEVGQLFEQNLETVISDSMGQMLMVLGQAMISGEGDFTEKMEAFAQSVNELEQTVEQKLEQGAATIERQGEQLCQHWLELDRAEQQLHKQIPQLKPFQLVVANDNELGFLR